MHTFVFLNNEDRYRYEQEEEYQIANEGKFNPPNIRQPTVLTRTSTPSSDSHQNRKLTNTPKLSFLFVMFLYGIEAFAQNKKQAFYL